MTKTETIVVLKLVQLLLNSTMIINSLYSQYGNITAILRNSIMANMPFHVPFPSVYFQ